MGRRREGKKHVQTASVVCMHSTVFNRRGNSLSISQGNGQTFMFDKISLLFIKFLKEYQLQTVSIMGSLKKGFLHMLKKKSIKAIHNSVLTDANPN